MTRFIIQPAQLFVLLLTALPSMTVQAFWIVPAVSTASTRHGKGVSTATTFQTRIAFTTTLYYRDSHERPIDNDDIRQGKILSDQNDTTRFSSYLASIQASAPTSSGTSGDRIASTATETTHDDTNPFTLTPWQAVLTKVTMMAYIASMCVALPLSLLPLAVVQQLDWINIPPATIQSAALNIGEFWAQALFTLMPFCEVTVDTPEDDDPNHQLDYALPKLDHSTEDDEPIIWVANHISPIDTFLFLAFDKHLRGRRRNQQRPAIAVVYWKGLEENVVTKLLFVLAGFIPVNMAANASGEDNEYDTTSFKPMLKQAKQALLVDGRDLFILPEGQLNPTPENGMLPIFSGAYAIARMTTTTTKTKRSTHGTDLGPSDENGSASAARPPSNDNDHNNHHHHHHKKQRPIRLVGVYGTHRLWHADERIGMTVTGRTVRLKAYPSMRRFFTSPEDFCQTVAAVLGEFGKTGHDLPPDELNKYLFGEETKQAL